MEEQWAEIKGFEDYYISSLGRVKSFKLDKINGMILSYGSSGKYLTVVLRKDGHSYNKYIHRLVAEHFLLNNDNLPEVNHKDEDTHNNCYLNLEWVDRITNLHYGTRDVRAKNNRPKEVPHTRPVKCIETDIIYPSISAAAREVGVNVTTIRKVCMGKAQTCKNFHWIFV